MFEFVRKHTRLMQLVLLLLIFPSFVFLGVQGYSSFSEGGNKTVAKVAGRTITQVEWDNAVRTQADRLRRQSPNIDAKLLDSPEARQQALDDLVRERVLLAAADKLNLVTTDDRLMRLFVADAQFAFLRNPDGSVNKDILAAQGMSSEVFAQRLRQDLSMQQVTQGLTGTALAPAAAASAALDAVFQQRQVQLQRFETPAYLAKVSPSDAEVDAYYKNPANAAQFQAPEQASIEYVLLDLDALKKSIKVSDDELRKYYAENESRYTTPEERRASHILIKAEKGASAAEREKAKARAEALLAEVKKNPGSFADVARKNSADPGSAEKGGDLDFFGRGAMVKPFEDAAFGMKAGDISAVVETDFGYHIIQLTSARGGEKRSFESAKPEIESEVLKQLAQKKFSEVAVDFTNTVYEQSDSLKPAVDKFKLDLRSAQSVTRIPGPQATGVLASPKFLEALFANDVLRNKRNTDAVEIGPNQLASGRVVQYAAARQLPLADVAAKVRAAVAEQQAAALARKDGEARLAALKQTPATELAGATQTVSRAQTRELPRQVVDAVLGAPADKLPTAVGIDLGTQGYVIARITQVLGPDPAVAADPVRARTQYAQVWSDAEAVAYYGALKTRMKVDIKVAPAAAVSAASAAPAASR